MAARPAVRVGGCGGHVDAVGPALDRVPAAARGHPPGGPRGFGRRFEGHGLARVLSSALLLAVDRIVGGVEVEDEDDLRRRRRQRLLAPLRRAGARNAAIAELIDSHEVFHAVAWTAAEAYARLRAVPDLQAAGIRVHVPDWWHAAPPRPLLRVQLGAGVPASLGLETLLDFQIGWFIGDDELSVEELQHIVRGEAGEAGLHRFRGRWIELDPERGAEAMREWESLEQLASRGGVDFAEGMRLLAVQGREESGGEHGGVTVTPGPWLARVADLADDDQLADELHDRGRRAHAAMLRVDLAHTVNHVAGVLDGAADHGAEAADGVLGHLERRSGARRTVGHQRRVVRARLSLGGGLAEERILPLDPLPYQVGGFGTGHLTARATADAVAHQEQTELIVREESILVAIPTKAGVGVREVARAHHSGSVQLRRPTVMIGRHRPAS